MRSVAFKRGERTYTLETRETRGSVRRGLMQEVDSCDFHGNDGNIISVFPGSGKSSSSGHPLGVVLRGGSGKLENLGGRKSKLSIFMAGNVRGQHNRAGI